MQRVSDERLAMECDPTPQYPRNQYGICERMALDLRDLRAAHQKIVAEHAALVEDHARCVGALRHTLEMYSSLANRHDESWDCPDCLYPFPSHEDMCPMGVALSSPLAMEVKP